MQLVAKIMSHKQTVITVPWNFLVDRGCLSQLLIYILDVSRPMTVRIQDSWCFLLLPRAELFKEIDPLEEGDKFKVFLIEK